MDNFLTCLCEDDLSALIIEGAAPDNELKEVWLLILSEYYELKGEDPTSSGHWKTSREILRIQNHLYLLGKCIEFLEIRYSDSIARSLRKLGYSFNPQVKEPEAYRPLIDIIINQSKTKFITVQQLIKQLEQELKKVDGKKPSRDYFEGFLIAIEEMQKCTYDFETMTVYKYLALEKKYWHQVELLKVKNG